MSLYFQAPGVTLYHGDCIEVMRTLPAESVHAVVTDPPYGLEFMGKDWDGADGFRRSLNEADAGRDSVFGRTSKKAPEYNTGRGVRVAQERADEMTPAGTGHATSAGPYLAARVDSIRVAGLPFQEWCTAWATEALRVLKPGGYMVAFGGSRTWHRLASAVEDAGFEIRDSIAWLYGSGFPKSRNLDGDWEGWGTALKPAFEPIVVGRKPLAGTVAQNTAQHGTGALNIDATRVEAHDEQLAAKYASVQNAGARTNSIYGKDERDRAGAAPHEAGRWPTNVVLDASQAVELDQQTGISQSRIGKPRGASSGDGWGMTKTGAEYNDMGGASRFFPTFRYEAKAGQDERPNVDGVQHPTVKPLELMRWLCRLVTVKGGTILEPFAGSGTTLEAALLEGFEVIGIERETDYLPLIESRLIKPLQVTMFGEWEGN